MRTWVTGVMALCIVLSAAPVRAQDGTSSAGTLEECSAVDEAVLLDELNGLTQTVFAGALQRINVAALVDAQWQELGLDTTLAQAVDDAGARVQANTDLWTTFLSGWSPEKSRELTMAVANATFESDAFREAMDALSAGVANEVATQIGVLSAESASAAVYCLQTFIRGNYSPALLGAFEDEVRGAAMAAGVSDEGIAPGLMTVIDQHKVALGGIGVVIAAQITRKIMTSIASRLSQRVAGKVAGRVLGRIGTTVIPLAGWLVGAGMIAYDLYDSRDGALPEIQASLKSPEVASGIREEVAAAIEPELQSELPQVAREIANDLHSQWLDVKRDIRVVLEMASESPEFGELLRAMAGEEQLSRLVALSGAIVASADRQAALDAATSGALGKALELSADITPIVASAGSLEEGLAWGESSGQLLDEVIELEIYKGKEAGELDRGVLQRLVDVGDKETVAEIALLPVEQMTSILALSSTSLEELSRAFTPEQLAWVAESIQGMDSSGRNALVARLVSDPGVMRQLQNTNLLEVVPPGGNLDAALNFVSGPKDAMSVVNDSFAVMSGEPTWSLFRTKHGLPITAMTLSAWLLVMLIVLRLAWAFGEWLLAPVTAVAGLGRRRRTTAVRHIPSDETIIYGPRKTSATRSPPVEEDSPPKTDGDGSKEA